MQSLSRHAILVIAIASTASAAYSQDTLEPAALPEEQASAVVVLNPLFEYPVAPDELTDLRARTNWLMSHFWDNMNFKKKSTVDQNALHDAFGVYVAAMPYADKSVVEESVEKLLKLLSKNPTLLMQFTKAAEDGLYGPNAGVWIDEVYIRFLETYLANKKIEASRKIRYADQLNRLNNSKVGSKLKALSLTTRDGSAVNFTPTTDFNIIEFGLPDCDECRQARIVLDVDFSLREALEKGKASMTFVVMDEDTDGMLMEMTSGYSQQWLVGKNGDVAEYYDLRTTPCFYIVDKEGKVVAKNITLSDLLERVKGLVKSGI